MNSEKKKKSNKWRWDLSETISPLLSKEEISDIINRKLAYIIVEIEHNPVSYIKVEKTSGEAL